MIQVQEFRPSRRKGIYTRDDQAPRQINDFYPTPATYREAMRDLLPHLPSGITRAWEPAAGDGQLMDTLTGLGFAVVGSDLAPGRSDIAQFDFLIDRPGAQMPEGAELAGFIATNPPFHLLDRFTGRFLGLLDHPGTQVRAVSLFMPWTRLAADCRTEAVRRANVILRMPWRTRFFRPGDGSFTPPGTADYCWVLWTQDRPALGPVVVTAPKPSTADRNEDGAISEFVPRARRGITAG